MDLACFPTFPASIVQTVTSLQKCTAETPGAQRVTKTKHGCMAKHAYE